MNITKDKLFSIGASLNLPQDKLEVLWNRLESSSKREESGSFSKYLFYFGALITISAMTWFMSLGWLMFGGGGIFLIAAAYALLFTLTGAYLWNKEGLRIPAGLLITMAVCMVPLAIYGLQIHFNLFAEETKYRDFFSFINSNWVWMEIGTIIAGCIAIVFFPFSFLAAPIAVAGWFLSMDVIPLLVREDPLWEAREWMSIGYGVFLIAVGLILDKRKGEDYSFWYYLFGTLSFWCGLSGLSWDKGEMVRALYAAISILMMCFSVLVKRNIFMVVGALGIFVYLGYLAYDVFKDSVLFPFALSFIGLAIILLGIIVQRNSARIEGALRSILPAGIRNFFDRLS